MRCVTRSGAGVGGAAEVDACAVGVDGPLSLSAVGTFDTVGGLFYGFKITIAIGTSHKVVKDKSQNLTDTNWQLTHH